jgi:hypothetical protein
MPPASSTMAADPIRNGHSSTMRIKQHELAYNEMTMGQSGSVMNRQQKEALREKHGFCKECTGLPVKLYEIKKNKLNPLWQSKIALHVKGECMGGKCFVCHPDLDPDRTAARRRRGADNRRASAADMRAPASNRIIDYSRRGSSDEFTMRTPVLPAAPAPIQVAPSSRRADNRRASAADMRAPISNRVDYNRRGSSDEFTMPSPVLVLPAAPAPVQVAPSQPSPMRMEGARVANHGPNSCYPLSASAAVRPSMTSLLGAADMRGDLRSLRNLPTSPPLTPPPIPPYGRRKNAFEGVFVPEDIREAEANSRDDLEQMYNRVRREAAPTMNDLPEELPLTRKNPSADESDSSPTPQPLSASTLRKASVLQHGMEPPPVPLGSGQLHAHAEESAPLRDAATYGQTSVESFSSDHSAGNASSTSYGARPLPPQEPPSSPCAAPPENNASVPSVGSEQAQNIIDGLVSLVQDIGAADGGSEFVADVILGAMNEYTSQEQIQTYCLRAIWDLCKDDEKQKQYVMQAGATETIMKALRNFSSSLLVQEKGCGAIWSLGVNSHNRVVLVRAGACELVVTAMKQFMHAGTLIRTAIGALRTLSPELEARDAFKPLRASEVTAKAMMFHRDCVAIQRDGCAFLSNCAVNIEKQFVAVVPLEELDAVVQAMANHREEVSVMQGACFALKNYTFEESNCRSLRLCEGLEELVAHAAVFVAAPSCPDDAHDIMERMQLSGAADESIEDQAQLSLFALIESQGNSPEAQPVLEFMGPYDWSPRLISTGLQCLRRMCSEEEAQCTSIIEILADIIRLVQKNERAANVVEEACQLVATLSESQGKHSAIIEAGACDVIFNALARHVDNEGVVQAALSALKPLSSNFECWCDTEGGARVQLVPDAIAAHATCEMVQVNGVAVMSNLDFFQR